MMVKPGITRLDKYVDSRYTLVTMAAKRARMIGKAEHDGLIDTKDKPVTVAVNEIADGKVGYVRSDEIRKARIWEKEKYEAIIAMTETAHEEETDENQNTENLDEENTDTESVDTENIEAENGGEELL